MRWIVLSPFGMFGGRRRGRGYYDDDDDRRYRSRGSGGGCLRDAMLLEGGCCLAEMLGGNCLLLSGWLLPALLHSLTGTRAADAGPAGSRSQRALLSLIGSYQRNVSVRRSRPVCRYTPSCSAYAAEAITHDGATRGTRRAIGRLLRCRPGTSGGLDPVIHVPDVVDSIGSLA